MSNPTNSSTLPPEVAAFVSNTRNLIVGGAVAGGVVIGLVVLVVICCRRIRQRTSDEVKEQKMKRRKIAYDIRRKGEEEERARMEAKRLRDGNRTKRGRVAAYDAGLEKSFAEVIGGALGSIRGSGDDNLGDDNDNDSGDDGDDWAPTLSPPLRGTSVDGMSRGTTRGRSPSSSPRALGETSSLASGYSLPAAMDGSRETIALSPSARPYGDAMSAGDVETNVSSPTIELDALNRSYSPNRRGELAPVLGSMRRIPMPRSAEEEAVVSRKHGLFAAAVQQSLAEEAASATIRQQASEQALTKRRLEAEQRLLDGRQLVTGLSSNAGAATGSGGAHRGRSASLVHSPLPTADAHSHHRLRVVSTQDYYANNLL